MPRNRKPFRHKWPKGWRPRIFRGVDTGASKEFYEGAVNSVVRDRSPEINTILAVGQSLGHTHAIFKAHPNCCPLCQHHSGRQQRLATVLSWKYPLPHPNCWCTWETVKLVRKSDMLASASLLDTSRARRVVHIFHKAHGKYSHLTLRQGPSGKKRWMKTGGDVVSKEARTKAVAERRTKKDAPVLDALRKERKEELEASLQRLKEKESKAKAPKEEAKKTEKQNIVAKKPKPIQVDPKTKEALNKSVDDLRQIEPGGEGKVRGHTVQRHPDGKRFRVEGIVAHGFKAAALIMMGIERTSASYGQFAGGIIGAGAEMSQGGEGTRTIQQVGSKATEKTAQMANKLRSLLATKEKGSKSTNSSAWGDLSGKELKEFASAVGVDHEGKSREEIEAEINKLSVDELSEKLSAYYKKFGTGLFGTSKQEKTEKLKKNKPKRKRSRRKSKE